MNHAIKSIEIANVRGIRHITLPVEGRNLVLVGENGSGKSSVVDAIEYALTGHVTHLEGRQDVRRREAFPHITGGPTEVALEWERKDGPFRVTAEFPGYKLTVPKDLQAYFDAAGSGSFILHRAQLLDFINARDGDRYKQISEIIGLGDLDRIDDVWRAQLSQATKQRDQCEVSLDGFRSRLCDLLGVAQVVSDDDILMGLSQLLNRLGIPELQDRMELAERREAVQELCQNNEDQEKLQQVRIVTALIAQIRSRTEGLVTGYNELVESIRELLSLTAALEGANLEKLLQEAVHVLEQAPDMDRCPLCESPIAGSADLLQAVRARLAVLQAITQCRQTIAGNTTKLKEALKIWEASLAQLADPLEWLALSESLEMLQTLRTTGTQWQAAVSTDDLSAVLALRLDESPLFATLQEALSTLEAWMVQASATLAPDATQSAAFDMLSVLDRVDEVWEQFRQKSREYDSANYVVEQLNLVYQALLQARVQGLKRVATELQDDFAHFYAALHPDEGCENITLWVPEDRRASVGLRVAFHSRNSMHPLNYFSEGHLDSLGLCIFLAFIRRFNGDFRLMVLDDIWTAVDAGHRLKVAQLLAREFGDYQMIVTTHDRLWSEQLNTLLPNSKVIHLRPWNLELGTCCLQTEPSDWDYYRQQVSNGRVQDAIAGVGRNLEKFLYQMRGNLGVAVPATPNDVYTIGDLYGPFFKWIGDHRPIVRKDWQGFDDDVQTMREQLDAVWRLRNWSGAHFNEWAHVSTQEAFDFLDAVQRFVEAFSCPVCGALVIHDRAHEALICPSCKVVPWVPVTDQYKSDWRGDAERMLSTRNPKVLKRVGPMVNSVLQRFLTDMAHRLPVHLETGDGGTDLAARYGPLLTWAKQHPRDGVTHWMDAVCGMESALAAYWSAIHAIPDDRKPELVNAVGAFTDLFACPTCMGLLSFDADRRRYFCATCEQQGTAPQKMSAFWPIGRH